MPTPDERKALLFIAAVALLGGAVRVVSAMRDADRPIPSEDLAALERQLGAADSAASAAKAERASGRGRRPRKLKQRPEKSGMAASSAPQAAAPPTLPYGMPAERPPITVDLDRATAEQVAALPGIGPSLAQRIVRWRDSAGGLGGLEALDCVSGVGPALLARVRSHVTFSGSPRPSCAAPRAAGSRPRARRP